MSSYTQYSQAWLEEPSAIRIVLMQAQVYDVVAAVNKYLYISTHNYITTDGTTAWMAVVRNNITLNETLTQDGTGAMTFGDIEILNSNGEWDTYLDQTKYIWSNKTIKIYYGDATWDCTNFADVQTKFLTIFDGIIDDADSRNRTSFNIKIRDKLERLNTALTEDKLGVYGVWAGGQQNMDAIKPIVFGEVFNITPMAIDPSKLKYMYNNGTSDALIEIRDNGMPLKASVVVGPTLSTTVNAAGAITAATIISGGSNLVVDDQFYIIEGNTNFLQYSEAFNNPIWPYSSLTPNTPNTTAIAAPDGTNTAEILNSTATGSSIFQAIPRSGTGTYTASVYSNTYGTCTSATLQVEFSGSVVQIFSVTFNPSTGAFISYSGVSYSIDSFGSGWYRVSVTATGTNASNNLVTWRLVDNATSNYVALWGAQLNSGLISNYISTTSSPITKSSNLNNKAIFTGNIDGTTLTVNSVTSGTISVNMIITGSNIPFTSTVTTKITSGTYPTFIIAVSDPSITIPTTTGLTITGVSTSAVYKVLTVDSVTGAALTGTLVDSAGTPVGTTGNGYAISGIRNTGLHNIGTTRKINAVDNSVGIFCLAYQPAGTVTCSVRGINNSTSLTTGALVTGTYSNTIASNIALIATQYGKPTQKFASSDLDLVNLAAAAATTALTGVAVVDTANILVVCRQLANSVGGQLFITRQGKLQLLRYGDPHTSDLAVTQITENDILYNSLIISGRPGVLGAVKLGYAKNYTVQTGLVTSILQAHKDTLAQDWLNLTLLDQDTIKLYSLSQDAVQMDTLLINNVGAATEAKRRLDFYKKQHIMYKFTGTAKMLGLKLGQSVTLVHSRFNLYNSNVHPYPRDIGAWAGTGITGSLIAYNGTLSRDTTVTDSPAGGVPLKMVATGTGTYTRSYDASRWNLAPTIAGEIWTLSVWVKAAATTSASIYIYAADSTGNALTPGTELAITVRPYWRQVSLTATIVNTTTAAAFIQVRLDGPNSGYITGSSTIRPQIWWDGIKVEKKSGSGVSGKGVSGQVISLSPNWTTGHVDVEVLT